MAPVSGACVMGINLSLHEVMLSV